MEQLTNSTSLVEAGGTSTLVTIFLLAVLLALSILSYKEHRDRVKKDAGTTRINNIQPEEDDDKVKKDEKDPQV